MNTNCKTTNVEIFKNYIKTKLNVNLTLLEKYNKKKFRQFKWYSYINKKRTYSKLLTKIEDKYFQKEKEKYKDVQERKKHCLLIMGDWSIGKQMANFISTPNLELKRKLRERFTVYNIDEYKTSCINYITEEKSENLVMKIEDIKTLKEKFKKLLNETPELKAKILKQYKAIKGRKRVKLMRKHINTDEIKKIKTKMHAILTYKMETNRAEHAINTTINNKRLACINRDKNGCKNIEKIFNEYMRSGMRPNIYSR